MKYYGIQNEVKAYINRLQDENGITVSPFNIKTINDRVESLKKSGVWSRFSLGFNDIDGDNYLARAGVTDPLGRCEILWFTRGMKSLDLWRNMISWPMRSYQNIGTGSTVYSLGGLGIFDGTGFNSPVWSDLGINFNGTNNYINTSLNAINYPNGYAQFLSFNPSSLNPAVASYMGAEGTTLDTRNGMIRKPVGITNNAEITVTFNSLQLEPDTIINYNSWNTVHTRMITPSVSIGSNGGSETTSTGTGSYNPITTNDRFGFGARTKLSTPSNFSIMTCSFGAFIGAIVTYQQMLLFNNLYKSTLGNGLGLP